MTSGRSDICRRYRVDQSEIDEAAQTTEVDFENALRLPVKPLQNPASL
jgi:hypothetical protein